jgi:copper(I)-binding protein
MRTLKLAAVLTICVLGLATLLSAAHNQYGVADSQKITFDNPMKIGNVVLPAGEYTVEHTMEGDQHVMVFRQDKGAHAEFKVKCTLVPLTAKAPQTQKVYVVNAANERELHELIFQGDMAKHVF